MVGLAGLKQSEDPDWEVQWSKGVGCRIPVGHTEARMECGCPHCVVGAQIQQGQSKELLWLSTGQSFHLPFLEPRSGLSDLLLQIMMVQFRKDSDLPRVVQGQQWG